MEEKLQVIKRKLNNEILENESNVYINFDEYLTTDDIQWLIQQVETLESDIAFFKKRQEVNKQVTQELASLNDIRVIEILTKTRIIGEPFQEEMTAEKFLKGLNDFSDTCSSCKFFNSTTNECREKKIVVSNKEPRCEKWRYFA